MIMAIKMRMAKIMVRNREGKKDEEIENMVITKIATMSSYNCRQGDDALSDGRQHGPTAVLPQVKRSKITKMRS